jgi:hypothetical protein
MASVLRRNYRLGTGIPALHFSRGFTSIAVLNPTIINAFNTIVISLKITLHCLVKQNF